MFFMLQGKLPTIDAAAVTEALKEYVTARKRLGILAWIGQVDYYDDYDHKKARKPRSS